jgi:hypothetical protein
MSRALTLSKAPRHQAPHPWADNADANLRTCATFQGRSSEPASPSKSNYRYGRWGLRDLGASPGLTCRAIFFPARASSALKVPCGKPKIRAVSEIESPIKTRG